MRVKDICLEKLLGAGILMLLLNMQGNPQVHGSTTPDYRTGTAPLQTSATPFPFEKIGGPLPDTVKALKKPYLVVADIEVPINKIVTIEKGVVFLFKAFTGMHVLGKIDARGTNDAPVIFTSENDRLMGAVTSLHPVPYDWNGIYIHACAVSSRMAFCKVRYSVYGIVSETKFIKLNPVTFTLNGKSDLVVEGKKLVVTDKPFWYKDPSEIPVDPLAHRREGLRYAGIAVALAAGAGTVYYTVQWNRAQINLSRISNLNSVALHPYNRIDWTNARDKRNNFGNTTVVSGALAVLGMIGVSWSFRF